MKNLFNYSLKLYHKNGVDNYGIFRIPGLGFKEPPVYKVKKFACKSLKGKGAGTGFRLIYSYFQEEDKLELIEIYYKQDKKNIE